MALWLLDVTIYCLSFELMISISLVFEGIFKFTYFLCKIPK